MSFDFKVNASQEAVKDYEGGGNYINKSGMYEIILKAVVIDQSAKGAQSLTFWIEHEGQEQPLFQAIRLTNNDGKTNLNADMFNKLCVVCGFKDGDDLNSTSTVSLPMGAKGAEKEVEVLDAFEDVPLFIRVQMEYSLYEEKNEIQERKLLRNVFRFEDKATAAEIVNEGKEDVTPGKQFAIEESKCDKVLYKGVTEEDVEAWKKNRSGGSSKENKTEKKPSDGFSGKKFGKKD